MLVNVTPLMLSQFEVQRNKKFHADKCFLQKFAYPLSFRMKAIFCTCCMKNDLILNYLEMNHNACCSFEALIIQEEPAPFIQAQINQTSSLWNTAHFFHQVTVHVGGWKWKQRWRDKLVHVFLRLCVSVRGPQKPMDLDCSLWDYPVCSQMCFLCFGLPSPTREKPFDLFPKRMFWVQKLYQQNLRHDFDIIS